MSTVLIVDDHALNRAFLMTLLGYGKHRLLEAADGVEGLKLVQSERPDLVISDILMPNMDGHEFVMRMRADPQFADMPVIFYTAGYHEAEARVIARACGVKCVLSKPAEPELILRAVEEALGLPSQIVALPALTAPPPEGSRFSTMDSQLAEYMVELESSQTLIAQLVSNPELTTPDGLDRHDVTRRLATSLVKLQAASARMSALVEVSQEVAAELNTEQTEIILAQHPTLLEPDEEIDEPGLRVSQERARFQARLSKALRYCGFPHDSPTQLAREFNARFTGRPVTIHAVRKWLVGESIPTQDKLRILAQWLGVTAEWLRFGDDERRAVGATLELSSEEAKLMSQLQELDPYHRRLAHDFISMLVKKRAQDAIQPRLDSPADASDD